MASQGFLEAEVDRWARGIGKGSTRLALLALLDGKESYGYQIVARLKQRGTTMLPSTEAAVYPMLKDLEKKGLLKAYWKTVGDGVPPRKYYQLTAEGSILLSRLKEAWAQYREEMENVLGGL